MNVENKPVRSRTSEMTIRNVTYIVATHFNENGRETAEEKLLKLVGERVAEAINPPKKSAT